MLKINPNKHLFYRVQQLGLSAVLSDYLLYGLPLKLHELRSSNKDSDQPHNIKWPQTND